MEKKDSGTGPAASTPNAQSALSAISSHSVRLPRARCKVTSWTSSKNSRLRLTSKVLT